MAIQYPTREQLQAISKRFLEHHAQLEGLATSLEKDADVLFPPFTEHHTEKDYLDAVTAYLRRSSQILKDFSEGYLSRMQSSEEYDAAKMVETFNF